MNRRISLGLTIVLVLLSALIGFSTAFTLAIIMDEPSSDGSGSVNESHGHAYANVNFEFEKLAVVDQLFSENSICSLDGDELTDWMIHGYIAGANDRYGAYYNADSADDLLADRGGDIQGIGINITYNPDYGCIEVINVMPDSPALEAGILPGDLITYVGTGEDSESVAELGYEIAVSKLQGKAGTNAEFTVQRGDDYSEIIEYSIERRVVAEQTVRYRVYEGDDTIGIIQILSFNGKTAAQFLEAFASLMDSGVEKLVFDVRYNPGGSLDSVLTILDYLLPEGPMIRIAYANGEEQVYNSDAAEFDLPMAVLVSGNTASAGELFCAALKDYGKAPVIGTQTYGKGTMQSLFEIGDGSLISISVAYYNPPISDNYNGIGVAPDIEVDLTDEQKKVSIYKISDMDDPQMQTAIAVLNGTYAAD